MIYKKVPVVGKSKKSPRYVLSVKNMIGDGCTYLTNKYELYVKDFKSIEDCEMLVYALERLFDKLQHPDDGISNEDAKEVYEDIKGTRIQEFFIDNYGFNVNSFDSLNKFKDAWNGGVCEFDLIEYCECSFVVIQGASVEYIDENEIKYNCIKGE